MVASMTAAADELAWSLSGKGSTWLELATQHSHNVLLGLQHRRGSMETRQSVEAERDGEGQRGRRQSVTAMMAMLLDAVQFDEAMAKKFEYCRMISIADYDERVEAAAAKVEAAVPQKSYRVNASVYLELGCSGQNETITRRPLCGNTQAQTRSRRVADNGAR